MPRLLVHPRSPGAWEVQLKPGKNILGRGFSNDVNLGDTSVSGSHCEITIEDTQATIKDLGSTNGTFVNRAQVNEATLRDGAVLHLGEVEMVFYSDGEAPAAPRPTREINPARPQVRILTSALKARPTAAPEADSAPHVPPPLPVAQPPRTRIPLVHPRAAAPPFFRVVWSAFGYPFNGDGILLLVTGTIFFAILSAGRFFASFAGLFGLVAILILTIIGTGYLTCYLRQIVTLTATGESRMPDWPDVSDLGSDIIGPFLQLLGTIVASFLPAIGVSWYFASHGMDATWVLWVALAFGALYFPMAFLAVAMLDTIVAVNPLVVVPAIVRMPMPYLFTFFLCALGVALQLEGTAFFSTYIPVKPLAALCLGFTELYFLVVSCRILGLMYWTNKPKFGWLNH